jgi:hypothetical protein
MGNSTKTLQDVVDYAQTFPDLSGSSGNLPISGYSVKLVCQVAQAVAAKMMAHGMKWPWNRKEGFLFFTNSWQQDYPTNTVDVAFLFDGQLLEINNTMTPKPIWPLEANQNVPVTSQNFGRPCIYSTMLNRDLQYAIWGGSNTQSQPGPNPQPSQLITNPVGAGPLTPNNPYTAVVDGNGGFWKIKSFGPSNVSGTTGTFNPFNLATTATSITSNVLTVTAANNVTVGQSILLTGTAEPYLNNQTVIVATVIGSAPNQTGFTAAFTAANFSNASDTGTAYIVGTYPSFTQPTIVSTTITDGTIVWHALNPNNFGFRCSPMPTQTGVPYAGYVVYQMRPPLFTVASPAKAMAQTLEPVPDDFSQFFMDGFVAMLYERHPDPKIRAKHITAVQQWEKSLQDAKRASDRTRDNAVMYAQCIMAGGDWDRPNAAQPYGPNF